MEEFIEKFKGRTDLFEYAKVNLCLNFRQPLSMSGIRSASPPPPCPHYRRSVCLMRSDVGQLSYTTESGRTKDAR